MRKILVNRKNRRLFVGILSVLVVFAILSAACAGFRVRHGALYILVLALCMVGAVAALLVCYFQEQNRMLEDAVGQIRAFIAGDQDARIECDEEGEQYRLFHEINSLSAILNAHTENERRTKEFLKSMISNISHQLKTPLAALNIYNGLIREEGESLPTVLEFASLSEQELDRIETLVQNLLKITKLDAGTMVLEKAEQNVSDMMGYIQRHFASQAQRENKSLLLSGDENAVFCCDRQWLTEAISNIVKNAFDHTESGAVIRVEWGSFASIVQIIVSDNGSGIHPEDLPYIFKRFYRSRFSTDTQGIGLGLPLAQAIIEAHGGSIEVESELGVGTTFRVNLPIPTKM